MATVTIEQAQASLAEFIYKLPPGEELVITESGQPVAKLFGAAPPRAQRPGPGLCKGMIEIVSDGEEHLRDFADYLP